MEELHLVISSEFIEYLIAVFMLFPIRRIALYTSRGTLYHRIQLDTETISNKRITLLIVRLDLLVAKLMDFNKHFIIPHHGDDDASPSITVKCA